MAWQGHRDQAVISGIQWPCRDTGQDIIRVASPQQAGWTSGAWCGYGMMPDGPLDQNGEAGLMTSFETEAMEEDLAILGFPIFHAMVQIFRRPTSCRHPLDRG